MDKIIHRNTKFGDLEAITLDELNLLLENKKNGFMSVHNEKMPFNREYLEVLKINKDYITSKDERKFSYNCEIGFYFKKV
jgi:hypothetical protein